jgi:hypothetical protein
MEFLIPILIIVLFFVRFFILHRWVGKYPTPLPLSKDRKREILETIALWVCSVVVVTMFMLSRTPDELAAPSNELWGLISLVQLGLFIVGPLLFVLLVNKWTTKDLGFSMPSGRAVTIFAIAVYAFFGIIPLFFSQEPIPVSVLLFALYVTAFVEEFFFRAIIQGKLERALGQNKAWFYSGILFGYLIRISSLGDQFLREGIGYRPRSSRACRTNHCRMDFRDNIYEKQELAAQLCSSLCY